jgi:NADH-quinone oxidoreductase subunit N
MPTQVIALLPEYILTVTGVLIMLIEAMLKPGASRKPLGWLAILGTASTGFVSYYQLHHGPYTAFSGSVLVDSFSVFFHLLIAAIVVATLLSSLDYFEGHASHAGEYYALVLFGAVGMMFMTCSVELLMVFIGLEISSISTYIMAGFRKSQASASESSIKYFLLGSFATAFFLYGIALAYGATGSTSIAGIAAGLGGTATPLMAFLALAMMIVGLGFKVSAAPFHVWTPDVYQGAPAPVVGLMSTAPKAAAFAVLLRITFSGFPGVRSPLDGADLGAGGALHDDRQPGCAAADGREAHACVLQHCERGIPACGLHRVPAPRDRGRVLLHGLLCGDERGRVCGDHAGQRL